MGEVGQGFAGNLHTVSITSRLMCMLISQCVYSVERLSIGRQIGNFNIRSPDCWSTCRTLRLQIPTLRRVSRKLLHESGVGQGRELEIGIASLLRATAYMNIWNMPQKLHSTVETGGIEMCHG